MARSQQPISKNPNDALGAKRIPFHLFPETATIQGALAMLDGAYKHGRANYRAGGVRASIYYDACRRHLNAWFEGEQNADDSGVSHLGHALACIAILIDCEAAGVLEDDRQFPGGYLDLIKELTPQVEALNVMHKGKRPKHYTIKDKK